MKHWAKLSKCIEFDAGHRVPHHGSKCRSLHGHRYKVTVVCRGTIVEERGAEDEGMIVDFGILKDVMTFHIHDVLDHSMVLYEHDVSALDALERLQDFEPDYKHKVVRFPYIPTAENIARWCYEAIAPDIQSHFRGNLELDHVEVYETPTSMAAFPEVVH